MRKLIVAAVILALLLSAGDVGARLYTQRQLERRIDDNIAGAQARVRISGFPFLWSVLVNGRINKFTAHLAQAQQEEFVLDRVDFVVTGVRINRSKLVNGRQLEVVGIDTGTVTADMNQADFDRLVGLDITLGDGVAHVAGGTVGGTIEIVNNRLNITNGNKPISIPIPPLPMLPCIGRVTIVPGHLHTSCTFDQVPSALLGALK
jgi:hypothetical protein